MVPKLLPTLSLVGVVCAGSVWMCSAFVGRRPSISVAAAIPESTTTGSISVEIPRPVQVPALMPDALAPTPAPAALADLDSEALTQLIVSRASQPASRTARANRTKADVAARR